MRWLSVLMVLPLAFGGCKKDEEEKTTSEPAFEIKFLFNDIAGLEKGSVVSVRGKEAGKVTSIEMKGQVEVVVRIDGALRDAVRTRCYGKAESSRLGGASTIAIVILDPESPPIGDGETRQGATTTAESLEIEAKHKAKALVEGAGEALKEGAAAAKKLGGVAADKAGDLARDGAAAAKEGAGKAATKTKEAVKEGWNKVKGLIP